MKYKVYKEETDELICEVEGGTLTTKPDYNVYYKLPSLVLREIFTALDEEYMREDIRCELYDPDSIAEYEKLGRTEEELRSYENEILAKYKEIREHSCDWSEYLWSAIDIVLRRHPVKKPFVVDKTITIKASVTVNAADKDEAVKIASFPNTIFSNDDVRVEYNAAEKKV